jgi:S-adenosylmethionine decarboxylase proenzyme
LTNTPKSLSWFIFALGFSGITYWRIIFIRAHLFHLQGILDDPEFLRPIIEEAVRAAGAEVIKTSLHQFKPQGVSGVVILAESHLAVHTWPEHGYAAVEIFTCGEKPDPEAGHRYLLEKLKPAHHTVRVLERGDMDVIHKVNASKAAS